ncbi:MAG TPA: hypothetical protein VGB77_05705 [Abditibacteriaceae bacterium]|jgi:hypothetical protein
MKGQELFGVIVRTLGLIFILVGLLCFIGAILQGFQAVSSKDDGQVCFLVGVALSLVGWFFLRNASIFVRFAYHDGEEGGEDLV